jgi:hypothetical protein
MSPASAQPFYHPTHFWVTRSNDRVANAIGKFQLYYHRVNFLFVSLLWQVGFFVVVSK